MTTYGVCYYYHGDIKDLKKFNNYSDAMQELLLRLPAEFAKHGYIPQSLGILYYDDGEEFAFETLETKQRDI